MAERYILSLFNVPLDASKYDIMVLVEHFVHVVSVSREHKYTAYVEFRNKEDLKTAKDHLNGYVWIGEHVLYASSEIVTC